MLAPGATPISATGSTAEPWTSKNLSMPVPWPLRTLVPAQTRSPLGLNTTFDVGKKDGSEGQVLSGSRGWRMSHSFTTSSSPRDARSRPLGLNATPVTWAAWAGRRTTSGLFALTTRSLENLNKCTEPSSPPPATTSASGSKAHAVACMRVPRLFLILMIWLQQSRSSRALSPFSMSQIRSVPSWELVRTTWRSIGCHCPPVVGCVCPFVREESARYMSPRTNLSSCWPSRSMITGWTDVVTARKASPVGLKERATTGYPSSGFVVRNARWCRSMPPKSQSRAS
mmetsp:Transcript_16978/g.49481  ORF Transcript_16978/g.49481 Transcript_16978/m.49481 type:complete len:284 (+) Transcript_16978:574-1425(+)